MFHVNSCHMDSFSYAVSCSFECSKEHKRLLVSKRFCAGIIKAAFYLLQSLVRCVNCFLSPVLKNKVLTYRKVLNREIRPNLEKRQKKKGKKRCRLRFRRVHPPTVGNIDREPPASFLAVRHLLLAREPRNLRRRGCKEDC